MREVSGAVIAIVLVLCAVFVPVAFLGGIAGMLYKQFAVTVAVAVVISGIVALTLTPALCALLLKPTHEEKPLFRPFNRLFERFTWPVNRWRRWRSPTRAISVLPTASGRTIPCSTSSSSPTS